MDRRRPHDLVVLNGDRFTLAPSGPVPRIDQHVVDETVLHGAGVVLPLARVRYGSVSALSEPRQSVLLVISRTVAAEVGRPDLVFPDLEMRDTQHRIIGCQRLARFALP
jgi:hypothetical protein